MKRIYTIALWLAAITAKAVPADTIRHHWGAELSVMPGRVIVMDEWQSKQQKDKQNLAFDFKIFPRPDGGCELSYRFTDDEVLVPNERSNHEN